MKRKKYSPEFKREAIELVRRSGAIQISRHEGLQHVWDERQGVDFFSIGLRVQRRVALEVGLQAGGAGEGQFQVIVRYGYCLQPAFRHFDVKKSDRQSFLMVRGW
jgi:hypothetical protein